MSVMVRRASGLASSILDNKPDKREAECELTTAARQFRKDLNLYTVIGNLLRGDGCIFFQGGRYVFF